MFNQTQELRNCIEIQMATTLGAEYNILDYFDRLEDNTLSRCKERYGVEALGGVEVDSTLKHVTINQDYQLVIAKGYCHTSVNDREAYAAGYELKSQMLCIYRDLIKSKCGRPDIVMNITELVTEPFEFDVDAKVVYLKASIKVLFRFNLL